MQYPEININFFENKAIKNLVIYSIAFNTIAIIRALASFALILAFTA